MRYAILLGTLAAAILGYTVYWFSWASEAEDAFVAWTKDAQSQGFDVRYEDLGVGGYPFRLITQVGLLDIGFLGRSGPVRWQSHNLQLVAEPWRENHLIFRFQGDQNITVPDGDTTISYIVTAERARASLVTPPSQPARFSFAAENIDILAQATGQHIGVEAAQFYLRPIPNSEKTTAENPAENEPAAITPTVQLDIMFQNVVLPTDKGGTLGNHITGFQASAQVHGAMAGTGTAQMQQWATSGGTMDVTALKIDWASLIMEAAGTLTLDDDNRPLGAFEARFKGIDGISQALANFDDARPDNMRLARTALESVENRQEGGWITIPLTMQNGFLYMGPIPLLTLSPIGAEQVGGSE